jgi:tRNA nucleotidyltransferase (CCA-adding enzyme)
LAEDFKRRDFSVNAMAVHVTSNQWGLLEDPLKGQRDLSCGVIRVLHDKSFQDDPTRIFRAARYAGRYGWAVDAETLRLLSHAVAEDLPLMISPARRRNELIHLLEEETPGPALKLLWEWGLWKYWSIQWQWSPSVEKALHKKPLTSRLAALCQGGGLKDLSALTFPRAIVQAVARIGDVPN